MTAREHRHRLLVAHNFLSNITTDGTHNDTALSIFKHKGLPEEIMNKLQRQSRRLSNSDQVDEQPTKVVKFHLDSRQESIDVGTGGDDLLVKLIMSETTVEEEKVDKLSQSLNNNTITSPARRSNRKWSYAANSDVKTSSSFNASHLLANSRRKRKLWKNWSSRLFHANGSLRAMSPPVVEMTLLPPSLELNGESEFNDRTNLPAYPHKGDTRIFAALRKINSRNDRLCFVSDVSRAPFVTFSNVVYRPPGEKEISSGRSGGRTRHQSSSSSDAGGLRPFEFDTHQEISYENLLNCGRSIKPMSPCPQRRLATDPALYTNYRLRTTSRSSSCEPTTTTALKADYASSTQSSEALHDTSMTLFEESYDVDMLNNAQFGASHHTTTLRFVSYRTSIVDYAHRSDVKKEINEKFRTQYPNIHLTYSKLTSIKRDLRRVVQLTSLDVLTLATAFVFYERCVLRSLITKMNRKLVAGACLGLAAKMGDTTTDRLKKLYETMAAKLRCSVKEIIAMEVPTVVALDFALHVPIEQLNAQYNIIVRSGVQF